MTDIVKFWRVISDYNFFIIVGMGFSRENYYKLDLRLDFSTGFLDLRKIVPFSAPLTFINQQSN